MAKPWSNKPRVFQLYPPKTMHSFCNPNILDKLSLNFSLSCNKINNINNLKIYWLDWCLNPTMQWQQWHEISLQCEFMMEQVTPPWYFLLKHPWKLKITPFCLTNASTSINIVCSSLQTISCNNWFFSLQQWYK